jgi:hypothetical protein
MHIHVCLKMCIFVKLYVHVVCVTSENRTTMGLAKMFGIWKFPEFRSSELSERVETLNIHC